MQYLESGAHVLQYLAQVISRNDDPDTYPELRLPHIYGLDGAQGNREFDQRIYLICILLHLEYSTIFFKITLFSRSLQP